MSPRPVTTPVRAPHRFDQAALERHLGTHVPDAVPIQAVSQFAAGQSNPTYLIEGPEKRFVLRKKPPGTLLPSAHMVEREYRILAALAGTDVPVPQVHHLCEDTEIIGTAFYVMDHVDGAVDQDPAWPALGPGERGRGLPLDGGRAGAAARGRLARFGSRRLRPRGQLHRPPDPPLERPVRRFAHRRDTGDGPPAGVAARPHPGRRRDHHRPRRLPAGEPDRARGRAAHRRRARLGAEHPRPSAERPRPQLPGLLDPPWRLGPAGAGRRRFRGARAAGGGGAPGRLLHARRAWRDRRVALLHGLRLLPHGGDLPGRLRARPPGQCQRAQRARVRRPRARPRRAGVGEGGGGEAERPQTP